MRYLKIFFLFSLCLFFTSCNETNSLSEFISEGEEQDVSSNIIVDIRGEIRRPGLYTITTSTTLYELIKMAGGLTSDANIDSINYTKTFNSSSQIVIESKDSSKIISSTLININTASKELLQTLPGIGESKAINIIKYRETNGLFSSTSELLNVNGIGNSIYEKIKEFICCE